MSQQERILLDRVLADYEQLGRSLQELDRIVPKSIIHRLWPGENVQAVLDSMKETGGIIYLNPGIYPIVLTLDYNSRLVVIQGNATAYLRGFIAKNRSGNIAFEGVNFINPAQIAHIILGGDSVLMKFPEEIPTGFTFSNCTFTGPCRRAIMANCADLLVQDCSFLDYYAVGQDSQCILGWNGSRHHTFRNCVFEAASENVMYGGADAASEAMYPRDVIIEKCKFSKKEEWKTQKYNVKCLLEMKNIQGLVVRDCLFNNSFQQAWAQSMAVMLKSANQGGNNLTARTSSVLFERNTIQGVGSYITLIGRNDGPYDSGIMRDIIIRNNLFHYMTTEPDGRALRIGDGPEMVTVDHNTFFDNRNSFIEAWGIQIPAEVRYTNNIAFQGSYGIFPPGYVPGVFTNNAIQENPDRKFKFPPTNVYYPNVRADLSSHVTSDGLPVGSELKEVAS